MNQDKIKIGSLELEPTQASAVYTFGDESGYKFTITASKDDEYGWLAHVTINTYGFSSPEAAVKALKPSVQHLLRMLTEQPNETVETAGDGISEAG